MAGNTRKIKAIIEIEYEVILEDYEIEEQSGSIEYILEDEREFIENYIVDFIENVYDSPRRVTVVDITDEK